MTNSFYKIVIIFFLLSTGVSACLKKDATPTPDNLPPIATGVTVTGSTEVSKQLSAVYTYSDDENDAEAGSTFKWYRANDATGTGEMVIPDSVSATYTTQDADLGKFIRVSVTPKAAAGTATGVEVKSPYVGAIGDATTVTFMYNGQQVTYGILNSARTGKKWLDRNLGAPNTSTAADDFANYGDLFQWGRGADGHQLVTRTSTNDADVTGAATTATLASSEVPGHGLYILAPDPPSDWMSTPNSNLWQGGNGINNPCPAGWHVPTLQEFDAEGLGLLDASYGMLKLTRTGFRYSAGLFSSTNSQAHYWTSTVDPADPGNTVRVRLTNGSGYTSASVNRSLACAVRCIKN